MFTRTTELQIKNYHIFIEDTVTPAFGCSRDDEGVFYIRLYRIRLSIYGRTFNRMWKTHWLRPPQKTL